MSSPAPTTPTPAAAHVLKSIKTTYQYDVTGKPDTKGPGKGALTVRPEKVEVVFYDGRVGWISVSGQTVRGDGALTRWRDVGFANRPFTQGGQHHEYDELPEWVGDLLDAEGISWPNGREPSRLDHDAAIEAGMAGVIDMFRAVDGDQYERFEIRDKVERLVAVILPAAEGRGAGR